MFNLDYNFMGKHLIIIDFNSNYCFRKFNLINYNFKYYCLPFTLKIFFNFKKYHYLFVYFS